MPHDRKSSKINVPDGESRADGWQIIYTGFILILLCFFIMLTSFASLQQSKITRFARAFSNAVSVLDGGVNLDSGETILKQPSAMLSKEDKMAQLFESVHTWADRLDLGQVQMTETERGLVMTLPDKMLFPSGSSRISSMAHAVLKKVALIIEQTRATVHIEGHTDNVPIVTHQFASNWELSAARAVSVLRYFIETEHVDPKRLSAVGFSQFRPVMPNDSDAHRAKNRRVELIFATP